MKEKENLFYISERYGIVHYNNCDWVPEDEYVRELSHITPITPNRTCNFCKACCRKSYLAIGISNFPKRESNCLDFFNEADIRDGYLKKFFLIKGYRAELKENTLYVTNKRKTDTWKIIRTLDGDVELWHNNYKKKGKGRIILSGYHQEYIREHTVRFCMQHIMNYQYNFTHRTLENKIIDEYRRGEQNIQYETTISK